MRGTGLIVITVQRELYIGAAFAAFYKAAGHLSFQVTVQLGDKEQLLLT